MRESSFQTWQILNISQIAKATLTSQNKAVDIAMPDFAIYYRAITMKKVKFSFKSRYVNTQNRLGTPEIDPSSYNQLIFDKQAKNHSLEKGQSVQQIVLRISDFWI